VRTPPSAELANLFADGLDFNFHTSDFPGGEIRGQIVPEPGTEALLGLGLVALAARRSRRGDR